MSPLPIQTWKNEVVLRIVGVPFSRKRGKEVLLWAQGIDQEVEAPAKNAVEGI